MKNTFLTKDSYDILDCEIVYYVDERSIHTVDLIKIKTRRNPFHGILKLNDITEMGVNGQSHLLCNFIEKPSKYEDLNIKCNGNQKQTLKEALIKQASYFYYKKENCIEEFDKLQKNFKSKHLKVSDLITYLKSQNPEELVEFLNYDMEYGEYYRYIELKDFKNEIKVTSEIK